MFKTDQLSNWINLFHQYMILAKTVEVGILTCKWLHLKLYDKHVFSYVMFINQPRLCA